MKNNKTLLIVLLAFVAVLGGAYILYDRLSASVESRQLTVEEDPGQIQEESREDEAGEEGVPMQAPDFTAYDADGTAVRLSDYFGKPIVLNFWASWCGPCRSEMPDFEAAYGELGEEIQFLMVNVTGGRENQGTAEAFLEEQGYTFPVLFDAEGDASGTYGVYSLPTTYFIDGEGGLIAQAIGSINGELLQQGIDMILPPEEAET